MAPSRTLLPGLNLFHVGFFQKESEGGESKTKVQAQSMAGIAVG
jgi:hypothetical protein